MGSTGVTDIIQASTGIHFSGFHLENTSARATPVDQRMTSATENLKQPFVIGSANNLTSDIIFCLSKAIGKLCWSARLLHGFKNAKKALLSYNLSQLAHKDSNANNPYKQRGSIMCSKK